MTTTQNQRLAAKVKAQNRAHAEANRLQPLIVEALRPFIGKKVLTDDGYMKAVAAALPAFNNNNNRSLRTWRNSSSYYLGYAVSASESDGEHSCCYAETSFCVGNLDGKTLSDVNETPAALRTDFTVEEIAAKRVAVEQAEQALRDAQSALSPFPRYDQ